MYKTMAFSILAIHLAACLYYLVAKLDGYPEKKSWVHNLGKENDEPLDLYLTAVVWSL